MDIHWAWHSVLLLPAGSPPTHPHLEPALVASLDLEDVEVAVGHGGRHQVVAPALIAICRPRQHGVPGKREEEGALVACEMGAGMQCPPQQSAIRWAPASVAIRRARVSSTNTHTLSLPGAVKNA